MHMRQWRVALAPNTEGGDAGAGGGDGGAVTEVEAEVTDGATAAEATESDAADDGASAAPTPEQIASEARAAEAEALRQAEYYKGLAEGRGERPAPAPEQRADAVDLDPPPNPADKDKYPFGQDDTAFIRDAAKWDARQEARAIHKQEAARATAQADFAARAAAAQAAFDKAAANAETPRAAALIAEVAGNVKTVPVADAIASSDHPDLIAEHLASNPKAKAEIMGLSGAALVRAITRLDVTLPGVFGARKVTKAAKPAEVVSGGGRANSADPAALAAANDSESYRAWRRANPNA